MMGLLSIIFLMMGKLNLNILYGGSIKSEISYMVR